MIFSRLSFFCCDLFISFHGKNNWNQRVCFINNELFRMYQTHFPCINNQLIIYWAWFEYHTVCFQLKNNCWIMLNTHKIHRFWEENNNLEIWLCFVIFAISHPFVQKLGCLFRKRVVWITHFHSLLDNKLTVIVLYMSRDFVRQNRSPWTPQCGI